MFKNKKIKKNRGMTYVEFIVVLSIFAIMSGIVMFNYGAFQAKIDIKVLSNDIGLRIVQAQKESMSGKWASGASSGWKPSYGIYLNTSNKNQFTYFADLSGNKIYSTVSFELLEQINITKGNYISAIRAFYDGGYCSNLSNFSLTFTRPDSMPTFAYASGSTPNLMPNASYVGIIVQSPKSASASATIKIHSSGRLEVVSGSSFNPQSICMSPPQT